MNYFLNPMLHFLIIFLLGSEVHATSFDHDHKIWDQIIKNHLESSKDQKQTLFNYKKLKNDKIILKEFEKYLANLSSVTKKQFSSFSQTQSMAFLINAYNAFTVKLIINNYPLESIKDLGSLFSSAWKKKFFIFLEEKQHLDHIEHDLLRKRFQEPRIHFAVNCASLGCPNLQGRSFTENNLETLLARGEQDFFKDKEKNFIDEKKRKVHVSPIFKWFREDFEKKHGSLVKYLSQTFEVKPEIKKFIANGLYDIEYTDYSWKLNEVKIP